MIDDLHSPTLWPPMIYFLLLRALLQMHPSRGEIITRAQLKPSVLAFAWDIRNELSNLDTETW